MRYVSGNEEGVGTRMPGSALRKAVRVGRGTPFVVGLVLAVAAMALVLASPAHAATLSVNSTADEVANDGACTLREAIIAANTDAASGGCPAGSGADVIDMGVEGTVALTRELPELDSNIEIDGPGADRFTVRRATGGDYRVFYVRSGSTISITGITVSGGNALVALPGET
jgi:CSLREA domain-containing protein